MRTIRKQQLNKLIKRYSDKLTTRRITRSAWYSFEKTKPWELKNLYEVGHLFYYDTNLSKNYDADLSKNSVLSEVINVYGDYVVGETVNTKIRFNTYFDNCEPHESIVFDTRSDFEKFYDFEIFQYEF